MSAPLRYARILNGLSSLISRRSAISRSRRAMDPLSMALHAQAVAFDRVVEQAGAAVDERLSDGRARAGRSVAEETSAAARAADLGAGGAGATCARHQILDRLRRDAV